MPMPMNLGVKMIEPNKKKVPLLPEILAGLILFQGILILLIPGLDLRFPVAAAMIFIGTEFLLYR